MLSEQNIRKKKSDKALALGEIQGRRLVPSRDYTGHGTAVLGIAAGNGRASGGANRGIAYESDLLVVKMKNADKNSFPRTTELMEGVDYLIRQSIRLGKPIVVNISFGNNYGSHQGRFSAGNLSRTAQLHMGTKLSICTGMRE